MSMAPETKAVQIRQLHVKDTGAQPRCDTGIRDTGILCRAQETPRAQTLRGSPFDFGFWILDFGLSPGTLHAPRDPTRHTTPHFSRPQSGASPRTPRCRFAPLASPTTDTRHFLGHRSFQASGGDLPRRNHEDAASNHALHSGRSGRTARSNAGKFAPFDTNSARSAVLRGIDRAV